MKHTWTCQRVRGGVKCGQVNARINQKCKRCEGPRPKRKQPAHRAVLAERPYGWWVELFGERCGICGAERTPARRLDRDHDHKTGAVRGLLCHRCNRALPHWANAEWLRAAAAYLERPTTHDAPTGDASHPTQPESERTEYP